MSNSQVEQTLNDLDVDVDAVKEAYKDNVQKIIPKESPTKRKNIIIRFRKSPRIYTI